MLTVGLTGGIGSGKSTVAAQLQRLGAQVVDGDVVAREVVEPGTRTLRAIADRFGASMIRTDGTLDRAALAAVVFPDPAALAELDRITGPAIAARVADLRAAADERAVSVYDMPLLVERGLWTREHLAVVVGAEEETRVRRLVDQRGLDEADARHRIARQATDAQRRAAADVWVHNDGPLEATAAQVDALWAGRLVPYNEHLLTRTAAPRPDPMVVVAPDPTWPTQAQRLIARLRDALGDTVVRLEHIGGTAVPGLPSRDVIDLQLGVPRLGDADRPEFGDTLARRGFAEVPGITAEHADTGAPWPDRFYASMDPGRPANLHIREIGSPGWLFALQMRDCLRAEAGALTEDASFERRLETARAWARESGWSDRGSV